MRLNRRDAPKLGRPPHYPIDQYVDHESIDALYYGPVTVTRGSVLVLRDSRADSIDSRSYGEVSLRDVTGTVVAKLWPPGANPSSE